MPVFGRFLRLHFDSDDMLKSLIRADTNLIQDKHSGKYLNHVLGDTSHIVNLVSTTILNAFMKLNGFPANWSREDGLLPTLSPNDPKTQSGTFFNLPLCSLPKLLKAWKRRIKPVLCTVTFAQKIFW